MLSINDLHDNINTMQRSSNNNRPRMIAPIEIMSSCGKISPQPYQCQSPVQPRSAVMSEYDMPQLARKVSRGSSSSLSSSPKPSKIEFSSYDVLLMQDDESSVLRFAPGNHVGNERFKILLNLYRPRYLSANQRSDNEACTRIARELMETVCTKCIPNGKFYESGNNGQWKEISLLGPSIISLLQGALKNGPKEVEDKPALQITGRFPKPKRVCHRSSIVSHDSSSSQNDSASASIAVPKRFDAICNASGHSLKLNCDHTGNNRLKVMIDLRMKSYIKANKVERESIVQQVVSSIMEDASSHFLRKEKDSSTGLLFKSLSREMAAICIHAAFNNVSNNKKMSGGRNTTNNGKSKRQCGNAEVKKLMDRKKKKMLLGKLERRNGSAASNTKKKNKKQCLNHKLPVASCPISLSATPTTSFKAFQSQSPSLPMAVQSSVAV